MASLLSKKTATFYKLPKKIEVALIIDLCSEHLWQKGPYGAKIETEKSAKSPSTKNMKRL